MDKARLKGFLQKADGDDDDSDDAEPSFVNPTVGVVASVILWLWLIHVQCSRS